MSEPKALNLDVYLSRWIISDGNYDDFKIAETRRFALEFWTHSPLVKTAARTTTLQPSHGFLYNIVGKLVFATNEVSVIDCGVLAYTERSGDIQGCAAGDFVQGCIVFGVDPFFYFERLCEIPGIPALIYEWHINSMEQDTTPLIASEVCGRPGYVRDETRRSFEPVSGTDQNIAADTCPEYVLHCTKLDMAPRLTLPKADRRFQVFARPRLR